MLLRQRFPLRWLVDALVEIPVVLPPLVVGLSLLILFNHFPSEGNRLEDWIGNHLGLHITHEVPAVVLAQFAVAGAFAVRTMRVTFDQITPRAVLSTTVFLELSVGSLERAVVVSLLMVAVAMVVLLVLRSLRRMEDAR